MSPKARKLSLLVALLLCAPYLAVMIWLLTKHEYVALSMLFLVPVALMAVYHAVYHFERFLFLMVFCIPLSIGVKDLGGGFGAGFPDEVFLAMAGLIAIAFPWKRSLLRKSVVLHPVTVVIGLQVLWIGASALFSSYTMVSAKFLAARMAYLLVYYFLFLYLFRDTGKIVRFIWLYLVGLIPVLLYSLNRLAGWGVARSHSPDMAEPFFDDHTVLGACLAMLLPAGILFLSQRKEYLSGLRGRALIWVATPLALVSLALTFSRAAWMTMIAALVMYFLMRLRLRFRWLLASLALLALVGWFNQNTILQQLRSNKSDSGEDILATAASVTNVTTDESNKERVNRWSSALRMSEERPWVGWGPGTYELNYGIFQISTEKTRISTMKGDRGDAHSEYLGVLAEQGIPGLVLKSLLFLTLLGCGFRAANTHTNPHLRNLSIVVVLGLVTYFLHGAVNSFLDLDKAAPLFWGMAGMVVALDLRRHGSKPTTMPAMEGLDAPTDKPEGKIEN